MLSNRYERNIHTIVHILIALIFLLEGGETKVFENAFIVKSFRRNQGWNYIGRMNLNTGKVTASLKISLKFVQEQADNFVFEVAAVPASIWSEEIQKKCQLGKYSDQSLALKKREQIIFTVNLSRTTGYCSTITKLIQLPQKRLYNFVIRDCLQSIVKLQGKRTKVQFEFDVRNNQQHLSIYEDYYSWMLPLLMLVEGITILLLNRDVQEEGENWTKYILKISLWISIGSLGLKYIGHLVYAYTGYEFQLFDILYLMVHGASDSLILFLLVLLSFGWTVTFLNSRDFDIYIPLGCICGFIYMILTLLNKLSNGHDKHHMFDTIPAYIMILFRMMIFTMFIFGDIRSYAKTVNGEDKMRKYFIHLGIMGTIYMVIVPVAFMAIELIEEEQREHVMMLGLEIGRLVLFGWLAILSGWKYSSYRKVINKSFMEKDEKYY